MPVYNAADYLERSVACVVQQTFPDWELLLVDDCSPDGSGALCDRLAAADARIRVLHLAQNGGAGAARNRGIDEAHGRYLYFMDADDTIDDDLLETACRALDKQPAQLVVFGVCEEYFDGDGRLSSVRTITYPETYCPDAASLRRHIPALEERTLYGYFWNKLYDADCLRESGVRIGNEPLYEDFFFNAAYCETIRSMIVLDTAPYHYKKRLNDSLTCRFVPDYFALSARRVRTVRDQLARWDIDTPDVLAVLGTRYLRYTISALQRNCDPRAGLDHAARRAWLNALYTDALFADMLAAAKPTDAASRLFACLLRGHRTALTLAGGRLVYWVRDRAPLLFARAKTKR